MKNNFAPNQYLVMAEKTDISETQLLLSYGDDVCMNLLKDHTTQQNIYWATDSYEYLDDERKKKGEKTEYSFFDPITIEKITGDNDRLVRPRAVKSKEEQLKRVKDKAEVFTPAWICNTQNNLIDEAWFGRRDHLFNSPDPNDPHGWINNEEPIEFPEGKTWKDYVSDVRLEITCGEAPYLVNRYDAVTGEYNEVAKYRIGILDRKLRIVSENAHDSNEWILWAKVALRATYGFEWQGDNLLLAREAMFFSFAEHYIEKYGEAKFRQNKSRIMPGAAYIISWNIWQMDGLTYGLPGHAEDINNRIKREEQYAIDLKDYENKIKQIDEFTSNSLFDSQDMGLPEIKKPVLEPVKTFEQFCVVKDFLGGINLRKASLNSRDFRDLSAPKQTFQSLVNENINNS